MKINNEQLGNFNVKPLSLNKEQKINGGGILIIVAYAFLWGVAYGYTKEKFESGEWSV